MDPRMDVGVTVNSDHMYLKASLETSRLLSAIEVISIIDLTHNCEMTWYTGHLLSQTLFVSTYIHHLNDLVNHPQSLVRKVLRSYLIGTVKCCGIVWDEIIKGNLFENEDVNIDNHLFDFYSEIGVEEALDELEDGLNSLQLSNWEGENCREGLIQRLRFRFEFLCGLELLSNNLSIPNIKAHFSNASEAIGSLLRLSGTQTTMSFSDQPENVKIAFDLKFARTISSNAPPRPISFLSCFSDLILMSVRVIEDLMLAFDVVLCSSVPQWIIYFNNLSRMSPTPLPFVRSFVVSIFQSNGIIALNPRQTLLWLGKRCISDYTNDRVKVDSDSAPSRFIISRLAGLISNHFFALAANRPRGRRILSKSIKEWCCLYDTTFLQKLDLSPEKVLTLQAIFYYFSVESSLHYILMGFDLELYERDDDRYNMWLVVQRLSERANTLLEFLSPENHLIEKRMYKVVADLAGASAQILKRSVVREGEGGRFENNQMIFERRLKQIKYGQSILHEAGILSKLQKEGVSIDPDELEFVRFLKSSEVDGRLQLKKVEQCRRELRSLDLEWSGERLIDRQNRRVSPSF
ncbi:Mak10 subunit, NatC N-terminal acetyltransferase-domain-containing protein [Phakopsora pachyrhizi]|uniref:Mak10 subunit, NatC N-terminal acetyltransferase-domain-containing protein n=1 Tax=Phakopsora pachyrhizi TaxID=170000 RepID=A0AAV0B3X6_PHAPC|nr:Mak10 subunit, NatC N-terminal acetyltransferase-domain-containing protein [Phakopsora pachyrhizi]KAI8448559.1 Mak10 subunit, NatC N-terminal acetyltransferase-domain-containing protein [Phakopsora pachyrhizi]CAH7681401.1 Mak10 subunit, NatC N-terminal acetyltransferase-domain-containing protein [Phakopsora pachyrhizi]